MNDDEQFLIFLGKQNIEGLQYYKGAVESLLVKAVRERKDRVGEQK